MELFKRSCIPAHFVLPRFEQEQVKAEAQAQPGAQGIVPTREVLETIHEGATLLVMRSLSGFASSFQLHSFLQPQYLGLSTSANSSWFRTRNCSRDSADRREIVWFSPIKKVYIFASLFPFDFRRLRSFEDHRYTTNEALICPPGHFFTFAGRAY